MAPSMEQERIFDVSGVVHDVGIVIGMVYVADACLCMVPGVHVGECELLDDEEMVQECVCGGGSECGDSAIAIVDGQSIIVG